MRRIQRDARYRHGLHPGKNLPVISRSIAKAVDFFLARIADVDHKSRVLGGVRSLVVGCRLAELDAVIFCASVLPVLIVASKAHIRRCDTPDVVLRPHTAGNAVELCCLKAVHMPMHCGEDLRSVAPCKTDGIPAADGDTPAVHIRLDNVAHDADRAPVKGMMGQDQHIPSGLCSDGLQRVRKPQLLRVGYVFLFRRLGGVEADHAEFLALEIPVAVALRRAAHGRAGVIRADKPVKLRRRQHGPVLSLTVLQTVVISERPELRNALECLVNVCVDLFDVLTPLSESRCRAARRVVPEIARKVDIRDHVGKGFRRHPRVEIAGYDAVACIQLMRVGSCQKNNALGRPHRGNFLSNCECGCLDVVRDIRVLDSVCGARLHLHNLSPIRRKLPVLDQHLNRHR